MVEIILLSVVLIALCLAGLSFNLIFRKGGKFPEYHVGHNKEMQKLGITCVKHEEYRCFKKADGESCEGCGEQFPMDHFKL